MEQNEMSPEEKKIDSTTTIFALIASCIMLIFGLCAVIVVVNGLLDLLTGIDFLKEVAHPFFRDWYEKSN